MTKIITTVLLITTIFISGCAYKSNKIRVDDYKKTRELSREQCTVFDVKKINDNDFHITQTCDIEYEGHRHQVLKECQFSTGKYLGNSLLGMIQGPIMIGLSPLHLLMGDVGGMFKWIGDGTAITLIPITAPFIRKADCSGYKINKTSYGIGAYKASIRNKVFDDDVDLTIRDTVFAFYHEVWIGDDKHQYPLEMRKDYTFSISDDVKDSICHNKFPCRVKLYERFGDDLKQFHGITFDK